MSVHEDEFPIQRHEPGGCAPAVFVDGSDELKFPFGIDNPKLVAILSDLSEAITNKRVLPQRFSTTVEATVDDFELVTVSVTYARERGDQP